jgi:hypothetical protein
MEIKIDTAQLAFVPQAHAVVTYSSFKIKLKVHLISDTVVKS